MEGEREEMRRGEERKTEREGGRRGGEGGDVGKRRWIEEERGRGKGESMNYYRPGTGADPSYPGRSTLRS